MDDYMELRTAVERQQAEIDELKRVVQEQVKINHAFIGILKLRAEHLDKVGEADEVEQQMLDFVMEAQPNSRLSCLRRPSNRLSSMAPVITRPSSTSLYSQ